MKFMNLFTGKEITKATSTKNMKVKTITCHTDQPNEECPSVKKIRQLQTEIKSLCEEKEKLTHESAYSVINDINTSDDNILKRYIYPYICFHDYNGKKEIENKWLDFINLFDIIENKSKDKIINYLKTHTESKIKIADCNCKIKDLENQIKAEKQKLRL